MTQQEPRASKTLVLGMKGIENSHAGEERGPFDMETVPPARQTVLTRRYSGCFLRGEPDEEEEEDDGDDKKDDDVERLRR
jgi:hypothetical protein